LRVTGKNVVERQDILVGEVWICSGQSNMEWPMSRSENPEADIQNSAHPNLRLFTVLKHRSRIPLSNFADPSKHAWQASGPDTVRSFSAVAYYFGRALVAARQTPVGLVHVSWGGSPAEVWMSHDVLSNTHVYARDILNPSVQAWGNHVKSVRQWEQEKAAAERDGKPFTKGRPGQPWTPSELYHGMLHPLLPYAMRGAIWYQGESNAGRAWQYRSLFADMIRNWRRDWGQGDFPFLAVQLAPWDKNKKRSLSEITATPVESDWAELREAQNYVAEVLPKVGIAVITDAGDKDDIHPTKKQPVGERLALLARRITHGERVAAQGPVLASAREDKGRVILKFDEAAGGLKTSDGAALTGFAVAGPDRVWRWAKAEIEKGDRVVVSSPEVSFPVAVRYGWADFPVVNLVNGAGLPASPFRTDNFPVTTAKK
ncbi:MAG: sialate O-acetylesterase, partial [Verrucomicrobiota bacterium]